ncbi:MAG TPA: helix-turn-helix domain-containing protein [Nocardioidaceae bacterium]|nr:helix-turn-helix domain-containing protein [Nocardioidaceae bacterium]
MADRLGEYAAGIGSLAEPVRRRLYEYVASRAEPVGREEVARAIELPAHTVKFHLDRLVDEGLLEVEFRRLSGKTGPGAGRPSKLYKRSQREFAVSLPERRYDLVGHILASAFEHVASGAELDVALHEAAAREGRSLAATGSAEDQLERLGEALATQGYEPRVEGEVLVLANCPFDALAKEHTDLVCGLNRSFVQGAADGLACDRVEASLEPEAGRCCVKGRLREG